MPFLIKKAESYLPSQLAAAVGDMRRNQQAGISGKVVRGALGVFGNLAAMGGEMRGSNLGAARGAAISRLGDVYNTLRKKSLSEDAVNNFHGMTSAQKGAVIKNLNISAAAEIAGNIGSVGTSVLSSSLSRNGVRTIPFLGAFTGMGARAIADRVGTGLHDLEPELTQSQATDFLRRSGVKVKLFAGKPGVRSAFQPGLNLPGDNSTPTTMQKLKGAVLEGKLNVRRFGLGTKIVQNGGIIVPSVKTKTSAADWSTMANNFS